MAYDRCIMALKNIGDLLSGFQTKTNSFSATYENEFFDFLKLVHHWPGIVGRKLSQQTLPLKIQNRKLFIMTSHSLYAQELQYLEQDIIKKMLTLFPNLKNQIKSIRFQATAHFEVIKSEQAANRERKEIASKTLEDVEFHNFDPQYIQVKEKVKAELPTIDDQELSALLEEVNILYYQRQEKNPQ